MRSGLGGLLAGIGVLLALIAALLWTGGRDALDEGRFADRGVEALSTPEGEAAIVARLRAMAQARLPASVVAAAPRLIDRAVAEIVRRPGFAPAMRPALRAAHRVMITEAGEPVVIDLGGLRPLLARELAALDPRLPRLLPPSSSFEGVEVATGLRPTGLPIDRLEGEVPVIALVLALAAAGFLAIGIAISRRPPRAAAAAGIALVLLAALPGLVRYGLPAAARDLIDPPNDALAGRLAEALLGGWVVATIAMALAGAALVAGAALTSRRRA
ncbi:MAG: hypothetical protein AB7V42_10130 [Thermoleophilia bacterium]